MCCEILLVTLTSHPKKGQIGSNEHFVGNLNFN